MTALPRPLRPFLRFPRVLRDNAFPVAPEQVTGFLAAVDLLGPRSVADVRAAAHALLAPPPERRAAFDALFDAVFLGEAADRPADAEADDELRVQDDEDDGLLHPDSGEENPSGEAATAAEVLSRRRFAGETEADSLRRLARAAPAALPRRRGYRRRAARRGGLPDLRRTLRQAARTDGEAPRLFARRRRKRQRPVLVLIDVSGSMKARTEAHLRFAHALARAVDRIEVFTFGTRLTRLTRAMRLRNADQALVAAAAIVSDWDGGTRIGDALRAFLAVPRFAGFARGAVTLVLSDGLERGDPAAMVDAVTRLSRRAWSISWLTPLAADPGYRPETRALKAVLPLVDTLADGSSTERLCAHVLSLARSAA
ncbi:VWA domain-containing protein [Chthonobacter rhizosphaerae]|uniref:VWA domain-containing protein n=1 Tax=Chthonobacter rhizosphaerae TaxID=2735553 RepID=UPI0015EF8C01|nr:VWA domain-containing protein [Chthonobacter rhizosphaerae]